MRDPDDVADHRPLRRGDDPQPARQERQRPLSGAVEKPLGVEALLELLERQRQRAGPRRLDVGDRHLEPAARFVQRQPPPAADRHPLFQRELEPGRLAREEHAVELRLVVLETEIEVPRPRALEAGDLPFDANVGEPALQRHPCGAQDLRDRVDARRRDLRFPAAARPADWANAIAGLGRRERRQRTETAPACGRRQQRQLLAVAFPRVRLTACGSFGRARRRPARSSAALSRTTPRSWKARFLSSSAQQRRGPRIPSRRSAARREQHPTAAGEHGRGLSVGRSPARPAGSPPPAAPASARGRAPCRCGRARAQMARWRRARSAPSRDRAPALRDSC